MVKLVSCLVVLLAASVAPQRKFRLFNALFTDCGNFFKRDSGMRGIFAPSIISIESRPESCNKKSVVLENSSRQAQVYLSVLVLCIRQNSLGVFSYSINYSQQAYSLYKINSFDVFRDDLMYKK
jgi:hypothetical protein